MQKAFPWEFWIKLAWTSCQKAIGQGGNSSSKVGIKLRMVGISTQETGKQLSLFK